MSVLGLFRWIRDPIGALDESEALAQEIRTRQFHAALQLVPFTSATNVLIGAATAWTYRDLAPVVPTLIWFALLVGLEIDSIRSYRLSIAVRHMIQPSDLRRVAIQNR